MPKRVTNPPEAKALLNGARSIGNYDLAAAFADLVDNSIAAKSQWVQIICNYNDGDPFVVVKDNGCGMNQPELIAAMRPASRDPNDVRQKDDLGRFGWGMKSASLSQARSLTVVSRKEKILSAAEWDLDNVNDWEMTVYDGQESEKILDLVDIDAPSENGTVVIWQKCDRIGGDGSMSPSEFDALMVEAREKLSLIFHRYLEKSNKRKLTIRLNAIEIVGHDPFFTDHLATQAHSIEKINLGDEGVISVQPFVLPHFSKLNRQEIISMDRVEGSTRNQGFYVYRNGRLIISGTWFGIFKHGDLSDLLRVKVDIPNTMDNFWKISIDKNDAKLPPSLKKRLKDILQGVRGKSTKVYNQRGTRTQKLEDMPVWSRLQKHGKVRYEINRSMTVVDTFVSGLSEVNAKRFEAVLSLVEQTLPTVSISASLSQPDLSVVQEETDSEKANIYLEEMLNIALEKIDIANGPVADQIFAIKFFADRKKIINELLEDNLT